jgi:trk system potassium uptake protein TrkH
MINFRIIARVISQMLIIEGLFMLISAFISFIYKEQAASPLFYSALITIVTGILVFTPLRNEERASGTREGYILIVGIWIVFSLFSTLPLILSGSVHSFTDAFFESMAGFTTTAASIFESIESIPHGIIFWRSVIQWLGGIGIIIFALSIFPVAKSINIQLSISDFSGQLSEKIHPKVSETAKRLIAIYIVITFIEVLFLAAGGMPVFDAVCHSFSTISTGGFSTTNDSIAAYTSPFIRIVIIFFMFVAGTNMSLIYFGIKKNFGRVSGNNEFILYGLICFAFSLIAAVLLYVYSDFKAGNAIITGAFHIISIITTTGFYTHDYNNWSNLMILLLFLLMFIGGMAGSPAGGIKILRILIIGKNIRKEIRRLIHPDAYLSARVDNKNIPQSIVYNLLVYITLYLLVICAGTMIISIMDYDIFTAFSTSASMVGNIGPGIGTFGPFTNYSSFPAGGKWFLSSLMLIGRIELLTLIILFTKSFYKR